MMCPLTVPESVLTTSCGEWYFPMEHYLYIGMSDWRETYQLELRTFNQYILFVGCYS